MTLRRTSSAVVAAFVALFTVFVVSAPVQAAPTAAGRVIPLPAGQWNWSTLYGVAGPMWSSGHHTGLDLSAATGTPILAAANGTVIFTGNGGAYGNLTQIQHDGGVQTWYAHQSQISTVVGAKVRAGQVIGAVGATGNTTGPHLHFEVRINGVHSDPKAWLEGAPAVSMEGAGAFDPALAAQLRGELAEAEAVQRVAEQEADEINAKLAALQKQTSGIHKNAERAKRLLLNQIRTIYKMGIDPQWLVNIEAFEAGDWRSFADRREVAQYTSEARSHEMDQAFAALAKAQAHEQEMTTLRDEAESKLSAATAKMAELQLKLAASDGSLLAGTQFDGVLPKGGSPAAVHAAKFALSQVGKPYSTAGGVGPDAYGCNGFAWRAWHEAGSKWPVQMANDQALTRRWVAPIAPGQEQVGDLVFWRMNNGTDLPGRIDHVGIVINPQQGLFVHASSPRTGVEVNNYQSSSYYKNVAMFGRVIG